LRRSIHLIGAFALSGALLASSAAQTHGAAQLAPATADTNVPVFIATGRSADSFRPSDRELARWALDAWQRVLPQMHFVDAAESAALIRVYWAGALGGEYGEMRPISVGGRRGAALFIRPDVSALGSDIARQAEADNLLRETIVYLTCLHETGHALGLPHTRDFRDIMYFFGYGGDVVRYFARYRTRLRTRDDIRTVSGLSDADVAHVRAAMLKP
jgi:hypothetical protein